MSLRNMDDDAGRQRCLVCHNTEKPCSCASIHITSLAFLGECVDWVFGVRWTPEQFIQQAVLAGHPFSSFSGLQPEVKEACEYIASRPKAEVVNNRCSKLGEWLRLAKSLKAEETEAEKMECQKPAGGFWTTSGSC